MGKKIGTGVLVLAGIYCILCGLGVTNTFWGYDARHSSIGWKFIMVGILSGAALVAIKEVGGKFAPLLAFVLIGLALAASTGFVFTAGDIKQRVTYLNNHGKVVDTTVLFGCYENFYHFKENPELKEYVIKYGELPGRNLWNAFILAGDLPKSEAPRANEDFKWHTGAYEMDLKNNGGCK
jgi:hypothetical protein